MKHLVKHLLSVNLANRVHKNRQANTHLHLQLPVRKTNL
jgi:hypothetical protein